MTNSTDYAFITEDAKGNTIAGLTKREYFAGLAMQGILANNQLTRAIEPKEKFSEVISTLAIQTANALIAQINQIGKGTE